MRSSCTKEALESAGKVGQEDANFGAKTILVEQELDQVLHVLVWIYLCLALSPILSLIYPESRMYLHTMHIYFPT